MEIVLSVEAAEMLAACAKWRNLTAEELARMYVEDWLDIDYPQMRGRQTRRSVYRDGPLGLDATVVRHNWPVELGPKEN